MNEEDEDIRVFQEEYPDVYDFVLKVVDGTCDKPTVQAFKDDYGEEILNDILKIIFGEASEKDIRAFIEDYGDEIYLPIEKIIQQKKAQEKVADKSGDEEDEDIRIFQEEYPDVYEFVLKVLDSSCDDAALQEFRDEYGDELFIDILKIISGKASKEDIAAFRKEYDEIGSAILKMIAEKKLQPKTSPVNFRKIFIKKR